MPSISRARNFLITYKKLKRIKWSVSVEVMDFYDARMENHFVILCNSLWEASQPPMKLTIFLASCRHSQNGRRKPSKIMQFVRNVQKKSGISSGISVRVIKLLWPCHVNSLSRRSFKHSAFVGRKKFGVRVEFLRESFQRRNFLTNRRKRKHKMKSMWSEIEKVRRKVYRKFVNYPKF